MATTRYIAFLRGINVSGQKLIKMDALKQLFALPGFKNITTYIQSGNVLFDASENDETKISQKIEKHLNKELGYPVTIIIRSIADIITVIKLNPYPVENFPEGDNRKLYITFLSDFPTVDKIAILLNTPLGEKEEFRVINKEIYFVSESYGETKLSNNFIEKKLGLKATTRNWATVNKIIHL